MSFAAQAFMDNDPLLASVVDELCARHACHTVILYGSRASGQAKASSDYDLFAARKDGPRTRIAEERSGAFLDIFIYPEGDLEQPEPDLLRLWGGVVLCQRQDAGDVLLKKLGAMYQAGPEPLPADEIEARRVWAWKMLERIREGGIEGAYRRVWLLTALLEDYFHLRGLWWFGPKRSFTWLREHDLATHLAYEAALANSASLEQIESLVRRVTQP